MALRGRAAWYPNDRPQCHVTFALPPAPCYLAASHEPCFHRGIYLGDHFQVRERAPT